MSPFERGGTSGGRWKCASSVDSIVPTPLKSPLKKRGTNEFLQGLGNFFTRSGSLWTFLRTLVSKGALCEREGERPRSDNRFCEAGSVDPRSGLCLPGGAGGRGGAGRG